MLSKLRISLSIFGCIIVIQSAFAQVNPTSGTDRLKSIEQRKLLESKSVLKDIKFRNIGPSVMSGRVVDLDVNPDDPTEFYVAYATGGLWHTTNNGQSFTPIMDSLDLLFIGDIAVNWTSTKRTIWVGTGEENSSRSTYAGLGIYKTTDNGKHWEYLGLPESHHIGKIQLHPTNPDIVWVAVLGHLYSANKERGIYKSTDGGHHWKQTLFIDDNTSAVDLDINPTNPNELYAAMWYRTRRAWNFVESGATSGIYKSTDGGENWNLITGPGSGFMSGTKTGRIGIAVYPKIPNIIYAVVDNNTPLKETEKTSDTLYKTSDFKGISKEQFAALNNNKLDTFLKKSFVLRKYNAKMIKEMVATDKIKATALYDYFDTDDGFQNNGIAGCEVYRSDNGGKSWVKTNKSPIGIFFTYGYYFGKIYVSPVNENKVIITGVPLQLSNDGGKTWKNIDKGNVHSDHHAVWINPKRDAHIINGNDGGVNITYDDGENWFFANTPAVAQAYQVTTDDEKPYNVYAGFQDNGLWYGPSTYRANIRWQSTGSYPYKGLGGGDGMQTQVDTRDNTTVYVGSQFGAYQRMNKITRGDRKSVKPSHELGELPLRFNWQTPIVLSRHNQDVFYIGANRLYRSLNRGDSLTGVSADLTNGKVSGNVPYGTITTLSESPFRFGMLYAGTDDGNVQLTKDGGYTWTKINVRIEVPSQKRKPPVNIVPSGLWVSRVVASQYKEGRVYVTLNGYRSDNFDAYLYVSEDYGATWKQLGKDLPTEPLNVVREDPKDEDILYVGSDGGLYVSFDRGNSFMLWNAGMPRSVPIHDIAIQQRENDIILGTHGRSLYLCNLSDVQGLKKDPDWLKKKPKEKATPPSFRGFDEATPEKD